MAILTSGNILSEQRWDCADQRRVESGVRNDFDTTITSIITNTSQGYIIRGFSLLTSGAIGSAANGLEMVVDPGAVLNINASVSGTIYQTPIGTPNQILNAAVNTNVSGSFAANSTNYVGIDYLRFADPTTDVTKYIWNASANDEIPVIAPAAQTLTFEIFITTSIWAENVLPVAIVTTDSNGNVTSITDARWMLYSLETGGLDPNPNFTYPWTEGRTQPPVTTTSDSVDPFVGGDKQIDSLKAWMDAIMSSLIEIKGTPFWFTGPSVGPIPTPTPSLISIFQDLGNTVITGPGEISNGILPNSDSILITTGNIVGSPTPSNQLTSLGSTAGLVNGDFIFGTGIQAGTTIINISGSTITMSQPATLNGTGITVTFYSPSVITAPGQINWDQNIYIRVIGSALTYTLAANPSSADITLADDEVAYITLVRDVKITPNLIFTTGSPVVTSVGAVSWTSGLLEGDLVKVASDTSSGYYVIQSVNSPSQVTLTTNVLLADNTGATGAAAEYAFGSYLAAPTPTTTRNIYIAAREDVPMNGNTFWLFLREDNGGAPRVYIRFLAEELDNGESVNVSGTTSLELLQYIGAPSAASSSPQYVNALNPGSTTQITDITIGGGSTISPSQYFLIYSSNNARQYAVWFKVSGSGTAPVVPYFNSTIEVDILTGDSATVVATKLAAALNTVPFRDFSATSGAGTVVVTNTSAGVSNAASNVDVGAPFAISITQSGTGVGNNVIHDGDSLTLAIKELDQAIGNIEASLNNPAYDEVVEIVASGATPPTSLNGPLPNTTVITLPLDSRTGNSLAQYTVGKGILQVFLNGQFIDVESGAYSEVGAAGTPSNQIEILTFPDGLVVGDELEFRFSGGGGGSGGQGAVGPAGAPGPRGADAIGQLVTISIQNGPATITVSSGNLFYRANCASGAVTYNLPAAAVSTGNVFIFKKVDSSYNDMNVVAAGSDKIDGFSSITTNVQYESFSLVSDGTTWNLF
jgi:hypothetical protein